MKGVKALVGLILMVDGIPGLLSASELQPGAVLEVSWL
jgi:hypothetical protein